MSQPSDAADGADVREAFWTVLDTLVATSAVTIDRPRGSAHPRFPDDRYPLDYGYLAGTTAGDGHGIDVFLGHPEAREVTGVVCTVDLNKRDAELKVLLGCGSQDIEAVRAFLSWPGSFACQVIVRPSTPKEP